MALNIKPLGERVVIEPLEEDQADGLAKKIYENLNQALGFIPNTYKTMAHKPEFLRSLLNMDQTVFAKGVLDDKTKQLIAIAVSAANGCQYCLSAHAALAQKAGATTEEIVEALTVASVMSAYNTFNKALGLDIDIKPE